MDWYGATAKYTIKSCQTLHCLQINNLRFSRDCHQFYLACGNDKSLQCSHERLALVHGSRGVIHGKQKSKCDVKERRIINNANKNNPPGYFPGQISMITLVNHRSQQSQHTDLFHPTGNAAHWRRPSAENNRTRTAV